MSEKKEKVVAQTHSGYSHEEVKRIVEYLAGLPKTGNMGQRNIEFAWMVLFEMFEGMRAGEICGLHAEDIIQTDGIPCITVNKDNISYLRIIPIHEVLLSLDFLGYVINCRNLLFPAMYSKDSSGRITRNYSRRKLNMREELQLPDKRSFRHNVAAKLSGISTPVIAATILGHIHSTFGTYHKPDMSVLSRELNLVGYGFNIFKTLNMEPLSEKIIAEQVKLLPQK